MSRAAVTLGSPVTTVRVATGDAAFAAWMRGVCATLGMRAEEAAGGEAGRGLRVIDLDGLAPTRWPSRVDPGCVLVASFEAGQGQALDVVAAVEGADHVLAKASPWRERIMAQTLRSLVGQHHDGLGRWFPESPVTSFVIDDYARKHHYVELVRHAALAAGALEESAGHAATVAWELVMNGLFNAPVDRASGLPKYRDVSRQVPLRVAEGERIRLEFAADGKGFGVAVRDEFGSLARADVVANMRRAAGHGDEQIRKSSAGAGVGLYMLHQLCAHLEFAVTPGRSTEVTAILPIGRRYRDVEGRAHSLNLFFAPEETP